MSLSDGGAYFWIAFVGKTLPANQYRGCSVVGWKDGSTIAIGTNSTLCFLLVLCLLAFPIVLLLYRFLRMGTSQYKRSDILFWITTIRCCQRSVGANRGIEGYKH